MITCCVNGCTSKAGDDPTRNFFPLPTEPNVLMQWLELIERTDLSQSLWEYRVCSDHFTQDNIEIRPVLVEQAKPQLKLPGTNTIVIIKEEVKEEPNDIDMEVNIKIEPVEEDVPFINTKKTQTVYVQTSPHLTSCQRCQPADSKHLNKTMNEGALLKCNDLSEEKFAQLCDKFLHKKLSSIVKFQISLAPKDGKYKCRTRHRYPDDFKDFALNLCFCSELAYKFLKPYFNLPCKRTLNRMLVYMSTGITEKHFETFKLAVADMRAQDKICNVCVHYMTITTGVVTDKTNKIIYGRHEINKKPRDTMPPAKYAVVVAVTGAVVKWRQILAYALTAECEDYSELTAWIEDVIALLIQIGLDVRCLVTDTSDFFWKASKAKTVSVNKSHFEINGKKIFYIFNVPDLLREARNIMLKYDLNFFGDKVAKFRHIKAIYDSSAIKLAPKLTPKHLGPTKLERTRTVLAAQTFSARVAQALNILVAENGIERQAEETAEFVTRFNNIFDLLNSQATEEYHDFKKPYRALPSQKAYLEESLLFFESLKIVNRSTAKPCSNSRFTKAFMVTIRSVLAFYEDLKREEMPLKLSTRLLNLDSLELFFYQIKNVGAKDNTKVPKFTKAFVRQHFIDTLRLPGKEL